MGQNRSLILLLLLTLGLSFSGISDALAITKEKIITLTEYEIPKEKIIQAIMKDRTVFDLSVQDILDLRKGGVHPDVIKLMLESKQKFGGSSTSKAAPAAPAAPVAPEMTPEEKAAEDERLRVEAQRMEAEHQATLEAQRRAYAQGVLGKGKKLADEGQFVAAVQTFQKFLVDGAFQPGSEEYIIARFGIANALVKADLHQSAAETLMEVLLATARRVQQDPDYAAPFFVPAFEMLRNLRQSVGYSPPELEQLTGFDVSGYSQSFQDEFHYVLGEFFYESQRFESAFPYFERLSDRCDDFAKSLYLRALLQINEKLYRSAAGTLQQAILAAEKNGTDPTVIELSYLALARIAYANSNYYAAVFYYRKIDVKSVRAPTAFFESAWAYFLNGDSMRALGMFHALHSPAMAHFFYPELWILEATVYLNTCNYGESRHALERFKAEVALLAPPLKRFLQTARNPMDTYRGIISTLEGSNASGLPMALTRPLLADVDFYNLYRTIRQIELEEKTLTDSRDELGDFARSLLARLATARQNTLIRAGIRAQRVLRDVAGDIDKFSTNVTEIEIDLSDIEILAIDEETRRLSDAAAQEAAATEEAARGAVAIVGSDSMAWPFEGEFWVDEIPYYRSMINDRCIR
jgi:tetratricopeptide (TPR) repeat protein